MNSSYLNYIHNLRGLAILFILGVHCRTSFGWGDNTFSEKFWFSILVYGTIIFVFIAGFLFQHVHRAKFDYKTYLKKKFTYVILPYVIVSIPALINKLFFDGHQPWQSDDYLTSSVIYKVGYMLVTGKHMGPFWFIPMITLIYIISPLLIYLDRTRYFYKFLFPFVFVSGLFLYDFGYNVNTWISFLYYIPVYLFGMACSRYKAYITDMKPLILLSLIAVYLTIIILELSDVIAIGKRYGFVEDERSNAYLFNFGKLKMLVLSPILVYVLYKLRNSKLNVLGALGTYSFGIFFLHLYIIRIIEVAVNKIYPTFSFNSFSFVVHVMLVSFLSIGAIKVIKLVVKERSRYIVGS
ncbi:acyltransferase [Fulvivirga sp. M361]|uniref:acyltransferase family protein n=1 Tax=Fulvivirga sp. M361 TaxID=2594266 RepID=UPI00162412AB|nr:acyltransferase [Fulvivirga sp. M361]